MKSRTGGWTCISRQGQACKEYLELFGGGEDMVFLKIPKVWPATTFSVCSDGHKLFRKVWTTGPDLLQIFCNIADHYAQKMLRFSLFLLKWTTKSNNCITQCRLHTHARNHTLHDAAHMRSPKQQHTIPFEKVAGKSFYWKSCLLPVFLWIFSYFICSFPYIQQAMSRQTWTVMTSTLFVGVPRPIMLAGLAGGVMSCILF